MKKQTTIKPGQKRLTHFFKLKPNGSQDNDSIKLEKNPLASENLRNVPKEMSILKKDEQISSMSSSSGPKDKVMEPPKDKTPTCSPRKLTQKSIYEFSPTKENNLLQNKKTSQISTAGEASLTLNGKKHKVKKTPTKKSTIKRSPLKTAQTTLLQFSPQKSSEIISSPEVCESLHQQIDELRLKQNIVENGNHPSSKKRKFEGSPLKEKQNDPTISSSTVLNGTKIVSNSTCSDNSLMWSDDGDFVNLCEDSIVISPKKLEVKKRKCSEIDNALGPKCSLNFENPASQKKTKNLVVQDLSSYFLEEVKINEKRELAFDKLKRYEVVEVAKVDDEIKATLKSVSDDITGVCIVKFPWNEFSISAKDIVSVRGTKRGDDWVVDWNGALIINPDKLISGTTIVGASYCMRKSVLSHIFKESGGTKGCMVVGSFVHELFQEVLKERLNSLEKIEMVYKKMINNRDFMLKLFHANMNYEETVSQIHSYVANIHKFMEHYVFGEPQPMQRSESWNGQIIETEDIEENIWSPVLGIKGKIDATVEVKTNKKSKIMPLELKTGKHSFSFDHRGQVILYCMLLQQLGRNVNSGLLLYLNSGVDMKEIECEERESRDLMILRNGLSHWLLKMSHVEANEVIKCPTLPPPINRKSCSSCPFLVPCSAALGNEGFESLSKNHYLREYGPEAIRHLSESHINFIFHWLGLLLLEKSSSTSNLSDIWSVDSEIREKSGKCLSQMGIDECCKEPDGGFKAVFSKMDGSLLETEFSLGQLIVVSTEGHFAHALGVIQSLSPLSITLMLDKCFKTDKPIFLDAYEGDSTFTILTNSLTCLWENNPQSALLRDLIIDLKIPTFTSKLSSKIKKVGADIFDRLNRDQVRAVLQAIASENFILIKGMPGTGKTTTMAALIELLTRLKLRVLVTSFTHSAIDNILVHLVGKVKMLRLGPEHRIHKKLKAVSEQHFMKTLKDVTPAAVEEIFLTKEVVGVTCFGCKHPWIERQSFDICLVDEATQVPLPGILKPISVAKKFVLIGDPKQLPPLVLNKKAKDLGLGKSLFEHLERPAVTAPLTLQYRMNKVITSLANDFMYGGLLQCANDNVENATLCLPQGLDESLPIWLKETLSTDLLKSVIILDIKTEPANEASENKTEADVVERITDALRKGGVSGASIGVIATYSRQVALLKSRLVENIEINTVDQYQGRDKEIIIYSTTRSFASAERNDILSDWNRLTVGITRAKKKLIIIGNLEVLQEYSNFKKLISAVPADNIIHVSLEEV